MGGHVNVGCNPLTFCDRCFTRAAEKVPADYQSDCPWLGTDGQDEHLVVDTDSKDEDQCQHLFHVVNPDLGRMANGGYVRTGQIIRLYNFAAQKFLTLDRTGNGQRGRARYKFCDRSEAQMAESHFIFRQMDVREGEPVRIFEPFASVSDDSRHLHVPMFWGNVLARQRTRGCSPTTHWSRFFLRLISAAST